MPQRRYTIGYLNEGTRLHAITKEGPLCGKSNVQQVQLAQTTMPTCRRCLAALTNAQGRLRYAEALAQESVEEDRGL